jgi:hypothetical protein
MYSDSLSSFVHMVNNGKFKVLPTGAGSHNHRAELFWRHLCSMARAFVYNVTFPLSKRLLLYALKHATLMSWFRPVQHEGSFSTPWSIWKGTRPNAQWPIFKVAWGTIGLYYKAHQGHLQFHESNLDVGLFIFSTMEAPDIMQVLSLTTGRIFQSRKLHSVVHREEHLKLLAKLQPGVSNLEYELLILTGDEEDNRQNDSRTAHKEEGEIVAKSKQTRSEKEIQLSKHIRFDTDGTPYIATPMVSVAVEEEMEQEEKVDYTNVDRTQQKNVFNAYQEHSLRKSLKQGGLGKLARDAAIKEINTIFAQGVFTPMSTGELTAELILEAADTRILIKLKKVDDTAKGRWICDHSRFLRNNPDKKEYNPTPTPDAITLKILLAHGSKTRMRLLIWDVKSAFLHADFLLNRVARVQEPELSLVLEVRPEWRKFVTKDKRNGKEEDVLYMKIEKACYGNPEANILWYLTLTTFLMQLGFAVCEEDRALYYLRNDKGSVVMVIHVDDGLTFVSCDEMEGWFAGKMEEQFGKLCIQRGPLYTYCSLEIEQLQDYSFRIRQTKHIDKCLEKYKITKTKKTPGRVDLFKRDKQSPKVEKKLYLQMLMAAAWQQHTRPQIAVTVSILATRSADATEEDLHDVVHLLEYLNYVRLEYFYVRPDSMLLTGWADAAWAVHDDGMSQSGIMLCLGSGDTTTVIMAKSMKQKIVAQSSTEGEIYGLHSCHIECAWAKKILKFLGHEQQMVDVEETGW